MLVELADFLVWALRLALLAGLGWGAWLCLGQVLPEKTLPLEHFATYALLVLLLTTIGGFLHAV
jgi:hypothetical protein